eukprot:TRINITY_DN1348_c0_g1::TRINITY_DN1348_c0_g1_i1::g.19964::m.19964 TRINITY_DN1348_c0_g1::TRINITY_DN1348_c0_g1_i1::g.19964  ORF type:complete len:631 (-),score=155.64,sp/Q6P3R8/NEK5_HUMAN/45.70/2e-64,Pkinase/PF00069.20/2e-64,Ins134_P3_kin/PF05770.6/1.9e-61,Pkinase_Tyr/PF07714.12/3.9e-42,Pkinase_Tyr/PF07714.12/2e+03,ATP-grasp_4/PF13535.1/0.00098,Kinase-like/PF14531.1/0.0011,Kinase-like/PF14531.1/8.3e+02,Kdo/PF06293.9/0.37 TRINITY_DN1348_c0_g1_i1:418-2310(-)
MATSGTLGKADEYRNRKGCLGRGAYGAAFLVERASDGALVVCKEVNIGLMSQQERDDALAEAKVLQSLHHPNIISFIDMFIQGPYLNIVMEYSDGGTLQERIQKRFSPFSEPEILKCFTSIVQALSHIHSNRVLHRDLKSENIFLTKQNEVKLGDFGLARVLSSKSNFAQTVCGTPFNLSPEICQGMPYNEKSDMWSAGCVLYELCTRSRPFDGMVIGQVVGKIMTGDYRRLREDSGYSPELRTLVDKLFMANPAARPTAAELLAMPLLQPYITVTEDNGQEQPKVAGRIGYLFYDKAQRTVIKGGTSFGNSTWPKFIALAAEQGVEVVEVNPDRDLEEQGPFHLILHRLTKDLVAAKTSPAAASKIAAIEGYSDRHPEVQVIDHPRNVLAVLDRSFTSLVFEQLLRKKTDAWQYGTPRYLSVPRGDDTDMAKAKTFTYPAVLKPFQSSGTDASHDLAIVFSPDALREFTPPYILQEFVPHGAILYKVYVIGGYVSVKTRRSMPDFNPEYRSTVRFNSQHTGQALNGVPPNAFTTCFDEELEDPPEEMVQEIATLIHENLNLTLFGFDIVRDTRTGVFHVIDINYFPGYRGVDFAPRFLDYCYAQMGLLASVSSISSLAPSTKTEIFRPR